MVKTFEFIMYEAGLDEYLKLMVTCSKRVSHTEEIYEITKAVVVDTCLVVDVNRIPDSVKEDVAIAFEAAE